MPAHFSPALFDFLFDLDVNNDRAWFDRNRDRFEADVREPVLQFIRDVAGPLHSKVSPHLVADDRKAGGSMFRINRDTRFSKDKRPYKTNVGAQFRHTAAADAHAPGLYLHLEPGNCFAGAGVWAPQTPVLNRIRDAIVERPGDFKRARTAIAKTGWELGGESLTRAPRGYDPDHELIDDLRRKSFILIRSFDEKVVLSPKFLDTFIGWGQEARPFMRYLCGRLDQPF